VVSKALKVAARRDLSAASMRQASSSSEKRVRLPGRRKDKAGVRVIVLVRVPG
jgi:hypothetical protein